MDLPLFDTTNAQTDPVSVFSDAEKRKEITLKLFKRRKDILSAENINTEDLAMNDLDLSAFGLTKVDYEIYLAKQQEILH